MARKSLVAKTEQKAKYSTRVVHRCKRCGRRRGYMRQFDLCRICFRELSSAGEVPGVRKASW